MATTDDPGRGTWPPGDGEMARRIREHDWVASPLGPIAGWPPSLRTLVDLMLGSAQPACVAWGSAATSLYNDGCIPLLGARHPSGLGTPYADLWAEFWDEYRPIVAATLQGAAQQFVDQPVPLAGRPGRPMSWFTSSWTPVRQDDGAVAGFYCAATETTDRVLAEAALREGEERQAFLLRLSDALRPLADPLQVQAAACRLLGDDLGVDRAYYVEVSEAEHDARVGQDYLRGDSPSLAGTFRLVDYGWIVPHLRRGETVVVADAERDDTLTAADRPAMAAVRIASHVTVPVIEAGELVGALCVTEPAPREWSAAEVDLVRDVAERIWEAAERARGEAALWESEARYRALFESMDEGFCIIEQVGGGSGGESDFRYLLANPAFARQTGLRDVVGRTIRELVPSAEPGILAVYDRVATTGEAHRFEAHVAALDLWMDAYAFRTGAPGQRRVAVLFTNVSERKRAEAALRASEARLRRMVNIAGVGVLVFDAAGTLIDANDAFLTMSGRRREDIAAGRLDWRALTPSGHIAISEEQMAQLGETGRIGPYEKEYLRADGSRSWMMFAGAALGDGTVVEYCIDINDRKRSEAALRASEERFRALVNASSDVVYRMGPDWSEMRTLDGQGFIADTSNPSEDWLDAYIHPDDQPGVTAAIREAVRTGSVFELEHRVRRVDGTLGWTLSRAVPMRDAHGEVIEWVGTASDVTTRRQAEEALRDSEALFRGFAENSTDTLWIVDADSGQLEYLSPAFERTWGESRQAVSRDLGRWAATVHPDDRDRAALAMPRVRAGESFVSEYRIVRPADGEVRWIRDTGFPIRNADGAVRRVAGIAQDVTHQKQTEGRQAFLLRLADALRPLADPGAIQETASRLLGEHLGVSRALYAQFRIAGEHEVLLVERDFHDPGAASFAGRRPADELGSDLPDLRGGRTVLERDTEVESASDEARAVWRALGVRARLAVPLVKDGRLVARLDAHHAAPRSWTAGEVALVRETAERTWAAVERATVEAALRASEERYRTLFSSMDQGFCTVEVEFDAAGRAVDYVFLEANPAFVRTTGLVEAVGRRMRDLAPAHEEDWFATYGRVAQTGAPERFEAEAAALGRWYSVYAFRVGEPWQHRVAILFEDITARRRADAALRDSEERFSTLVQNIPDYAIFMLDPDGRVAGWWTGAERVTGYAADEILGRHLATFYTPEDVAAGLPGRELAEAARTGHYEGEGWRVRKNGERCWVNEIATAVRDQDGGLVAFTKISRDLTERRRSEEALRASEERLRQIVEQATDYAIFTTDAESRIDGWTAGAAAVFGWSAEEAIGQPMALTFTPEDRAAGVPAEEFAAARDAGAAANVRWHARKDGTRVFIDGVARARRAADGSFLGVLKIGQDVTERRRAEQTRREEEARIRAELAGQVDAATAELRAVSRRLLTVQEEERRHLARELHDEIGQALTGLQLQLAAANRAGPAGDGALSEAAATVRALTEQVRQLSMDLRPAALDEFGIVPALRWHVERYESRTGVQVDLRHDGLNRRFPPEVEVAAFRVVQEALTNVARHANTDRATIRLLAIDGSLTVAIRDAGRGFDAAAPMAGGLGGMRERVELLGGVLDIDAAPGGGTAVTAEIPLGDCGPAGVGEDQP